MNEETLFELALNTPPTELPAFLERECTGDPALRERIEKLLAAHVASEDTMAPADHALRGSNDQAKSSSLTPLPAVPAIGTILGGKYKLIQSIGEGGMGNVYMAQQTEPVKRIVAVKVIKAGMDSKAVLARFEAERQALAIMDHPNIAKVLDAGATDFGSPYFVMELVKGIPITKFCDEGKLTPKQRLELFLPVCEAIQHSHQKGIIHRDIKPSNVLVAMYDDRAVPKVIDFGVAKATGQSLADADMITGFGALVGTPEYMSPEQASFNNLDIDTRSDVYSLGVLLYELLSGHTPVDRKSLEKAAILEILRIVRDVDAPLLSAKLSSIDTLPNVAANRRTEPKKLATQFRGELDWVLHKALEKDRTRRYSSASGFARDIQRYLSNDIVEARPPSTFYTLQKLFNRNKGKMLAASLVLFALLAGIAGTTWGLIRAEQRRVEAESAQAEEAKQRGIAQANESKAILAMEEEARQRAIAQAEKLRAIEFQNKALDALRSTTGEDVEKLIGEKKVLTDNEKAYLEAIAERWQAFATQEGTDEQSRAIKAEGLLRVANLWEQLGRREDALLYHERAEKLHQGLFDDFPKVTKYAEQLAAGLNNFGLVLHHLGREYEAQTKIRQGLTTRERLAQEFPDTPYYRVSIASSHHNLGIVSDAVGNSTEALERYRQGIIIEEKLANEFPDLPQYRSNLAASFGNVGVLLSKMGKHDEALVQYGKALAIREKLASDFPTDRERISELAHSYNNAGIHFSKLGQSDKAVEQFRNAIAAKEKLVTTYPGVPEYNNSLATSYKNLASTLRDSGKAAEAVKLIRNALGIRQRLAEAFPREPEYRQDLAATYNTLASLFKHANKLEQSLEQHRKAVAIREKLASDFPAVPEYRWDLATSYFNLGLVLRKLEKLDEAEGYYRKGMAILETLTKDFPEVTSHHNDLASIYNSLANLLSDLGRMEDALVEYRKAIAIGEKLIAEHPSIPEYRLDLAAAYANTGLKLLDGSKTAESLEWFQKAIQLLEPIHASDAKSAQSERYLKRCYEGRSIAYDKLQVSAEAEKDWNRFVDLSSSEDKIRLLTKRAKRLIRYGKVDEGIKQIAEWSKLPNEASYLGNEDAGLWFEFACAYSLAGGKLPEKREEYLKRAIELLKESVRLGFDNTKQLNSDSDLKQLRDRKDFQELVVDVEAKTKKEQTPARLDPKSEDKD